MKFPMLQIVIIAKVPPNEHFYLRARLEKKKVRTNTLLASVNKASNTRVTIPRVNSMNKDV